MKNLLLLSTILFLFPAVSHSELRETWKFDVFLDGKKIGFHHYEVHRDNDQQIVYSKARFDVDFLFFNAYDYEHDNFEIWQNSCLYKIESFTNDNGDKYNVQGKQSNNNFLVSTANVTSKLPECIRSFSYWNPDFLHQ